MQIRVFNYNTLERVHMFEAHSDYIRCIAVHPTQPYILTSSGMLKAFEVRFGFTLGSPDSLIIKHSNVSLVLQYIGLLKYASISVCIHA